MHRTTRFAIVLLALAAMVSPGSAQSHEYPSVAVIPGIYLVGETRTQNETAIRTGNDTIREAFTNAGFDWIDQSTVVRSLRRLDLIKEDSFVELHTPEEMLKLGEALGVDYVVAFRSAWRIRSIWVGLGPKTKAHCTTTMVIINVPRAEVVFEPEPVETDSTRVETGLETAAALFVTPLVTVLSGGPKTPHMQRSVQTSILLTLREFLAERRGPRPIHQ